MVGMAMLIGAAAGAMVVVPTNVPGAALQATGVYRLEVGGAIFLGLYVAAMAFALSLRNRGFTEISSHGIRARDMDTMPELISASEMSVELLSEVIEDVRRLQEHREEG